MWQFRDFLRKLSHLKQSPTQADKVTQKGNPYESTYR
nr:MAG TPA: hypothetical protein [Caudoviricetes sp.]